MNLIWPTHPLPAGKGNRAKSLWWATLLLLEMFAVPFARAQDSYGLVTLRNREFQTIEAKLVGPTSRTMSVSAGAEETVMVAPGKYYCLFHLREFSVNDWSYYKREEEFSVGDVRSQPTPVLVMPHNGVPPGKFITEDEFNKVTVARPAPDSEPEKLLDSGRLTTIDVTVSIKNLYYAKDEEQKKEGLRAAGARLDDFVKRFIIPKLKRQGFRANYLGANLVGPQPGHGLLSIDYDEQEGRRFSRDFPRIGSTVYGVDINCSLKLKHPSVTPATPVWSRWLVAGNDFYVEGDLYANALENLKAKFEETVIDLQNWAPRIPAAPAGAANQANRLPRRRQPRRNRP
jgi:hypothetical protein